MRHLISPLDFSVEELDDLLDLASDIEKNPDNIKKPAKVKGVKAVPNANAIRPRTTILIVSILRNASALVVAPTDVPSRITTMYIIALEAVSVSCLTTPDSRNRLPSINIPTSGAVVGRIRHTTTVTTIGNKIFSSLDTGRKFCILIARSFFVVNNFIIGG